MGPEVVLAGIALACLVMYALTGGADFGGGVWDLTAHGGRARAQREAIAKTIGPIWEANHVWLIVVIVILFAGFPKVYAVIGTALHIPLAVMLFGIVLRGTAFVFRAYDSARDQVHYRWSLVFAASSLVTPITFGMCVAALVTGDLPLDPATGLVQTDFVSAWSGPFPIVTGLFTMSLFAFLAATYLAHAVGYAPLREDFRLRGLVAWGVTGVLAFATLGLSAIYAPRIWEGLLHRWWSWPFQVAVGVAAFVALFGLVTRRWLLARVAAMVQVAAVLLGWGAAIYPFMVVPDLTVTNAAAPSNVVLLLDGALIAGTFVLVPSFTWLYLVFRRAD